MKKIALLTLLLINLSLSFSLPRNQASPAIFSVTKTNNSILFRHTDSTLTAIPCQSVASIVSNADPSKIVSVWVVQQGDYDKIMQFDYSVCGFSSKSDAVDSLTAWAICDTSSGGGGGGASLSGLTAATSTNNIQNDNFKQRWSWNTLAGDTAMVIASNSTGAASNLQNLLTVSQSGANGTSTQTTYGAIFSNTKTGTSSTNIAGRFVASGANNNYAIEADRIIRLKPTTATDSRYLSFWGTNEIARVGTGFNGLDYDNLEINVLTTSGVNTVGALVFKTSNTERMRITQKGQLAIGNTGSGYTGVLEVTGGPFGYAIYVTDDKSILLNGGTFKTNIHTNFGADGSNNMFFQVAGGSKMIIANSNGVSIGANTTPASSAILDVVSTTKGFLPPRMTATQASAISSPAQGLLLFVTDTDGTFTSVGWWGYNGATWEKLNN